VTADRPVSTVSRRWVVLGVLCLAQLVVVLDHTVLNVAIPALIRHLGAGTADVQWMINAYALVQAGLLIPAGSAADRYGRRRILLAGLAVFGAASLAAGLATASGPLIAARAAMGVGGAMVATGTLAIAMQVFDARERPAAIGVWAAVNALGFAAGPLTGGVVLAHFWWGAVFLVNVPVVVVALVATQTLVPESRHHTGGPPDLVGAVTATAGTTVVVYAIVAGPEHGWGTAVPAAGAGVLLLAVFVRWQARTAYPMLDLRLFRDRRFVGAISGVVLITFGSAGALFLMTQQLQFLRGYGPLEAGLRMAPFALSVVALNLTGVSARLMRRLGLPLAIAVGMALLATGLVVAAATAGGYGVLLGGLVLMGAGCALANPAIVEAVMSAIPPEKAGAGAGVDGVMSELGSSLGVAVLGAVLNARLAAAGIASVPAALPAARPALEASLTTGQLVGAAAVLAGGCLTAALLSRRS
jgi:EmrB/QacA subfamily drug resistance transporter